MDEHAQPVAQGGGQLLRRHDRVDLTGRQLALGGVRERVRAGRPHPGTGEPDLGPRQRQDHIGARTQGRPAAAGRRVAQDRELRRTGRPQPRRRTGHPVQLGERDHALLHPAAARGDQRDEWEPPGHGFLVRRFQTVPGALPERAAEEPELERDQDTGLPADAGESVHDGFPLAGAGGGPRPGVRVSRPAERSVGRGVFVRVGGLGEVGGDGGDRATGREPVSHGATAS